MSDRPMRLKYLKTKMKIILCIFLLCITAVSVFGKSQELHGIVGKSIEFTHAVKTAGSLFYDSKAYGASAIGAVKNGNFAPQNGNFRDRLQWDSSTGHFSLSELRLNDSGIYKVQNDGQKLAPTFNLTVWIPVLKPHLNVTRNEYRCTVLCAAARGTGATLTLYREGETNPYVTSPVRSHPHLDMTQTVESGTYTCEANNSVSRQTSDPLTVGAHCTERELNGILGESVKFPAAVKKVGNLMHIGVTIGEVTSGTFTAGKFNDRLQWDSSTGLFSLSELEMEDSGEYKVQNTDPNIITVFQLNVYKDNVPVSKPNVIIHYESCTIKCTAERGTGVILSWYREGEKKPFVSSGVASAPHLQLPKTVEGSSTYTCEAKNSVSRQTSDPLTVGAHCTAPSTPSTPIVRSSAGTIVAIIIAVVAVLIAVVFAVLYRRTKTERRDKQALLQDAVRRVILDNQGLIKDGTKTSIQEDNQGLLQDVVRRIILDENNQGLIEDAVRRLILVKEILDKVDPRALLKKLLDNIVASTSDNQGLIKDAVRRVILDEDGHAFIHDAFRRLILVKDILDKVDPHAIRLRGPSE